MRNKILKKLEANKDIGYQKFSSSLLPNVENLMGVRLPVLRRIAREIIKDDWKTYLKVVPFYMEETMLQGMVTGLIQDKNEALKYIKLHIPKLTNWSLTDSFCSGLKIINKDKEGFFEFIKNYSNSNKEFEKRFFLVAALNYFTHEKYLKEIFSILDLMPLEEYYAKTGAAWLLSVCYVNHKEKTEKYLLESKIDKDTLRKTLRKINESYRVNKEDKTRLKSLLSV